MGGGGRMPQVYMGGEQREEKWEGGRRTMATITQVLINYMCSNNLSRRRHINI